MKNQKTKIKNNIFIVLLFFISIFCSVVCASEVPSPASLPTKQPVVADSSAPKEINEELVYPAQHLKAEALEKLLKELYKEVIVTTIVPLNTVVIRAKKETLASIEETLKKVDKPVQLLVIIARIWEVTKQLDKNFGFDPSDFSLDLKYILPPGVRSLTLDTLTEVAPGRFRLLSTDTASRLLVSPKIVVESGNTAEISSTRSVPIQTTASSGTVITTSVQFVEVGIKLNAKPNVYADNSIGLDLEGYVSAVTNITTAGYPETSKREYKTQLHLKSDYTVVLGGLLLEEKRDIKEKMYVPILDEFISWLPLVGSLYDHIFGNVRTVYNVSEIIVTITPVLFTPEMLTPPGEPEPMPNNLKDVTPQPIKIPKLKSE